jgi:hypothetical protein
LPFTPAALSTGGRAKSKFTVRKCPAGTGLAPLGMKGTGDRDGMSEAWQDGAPLRTGSHLKGTARLWNEGISPGFSEGTLGSRAPRPPNLVWGEHPIAPARFRSILPNVEERKRTDGFGI